MVSVSYLFYQRRGTDVAACILEGSGWKGKACRTSTQRPSACGLSLSLEAGCGKHTDASKFMCCRFELLDRQRQSITVRMRYSSQLLRILKQTLINLQGQSILIPLSMFRRYLIFRQKGKKILPSEYRHQVYGFTKIRLMTSNRYELSPLGMESEMKIIYPCE